MAFEFHYEPETIRTIVKEAMGGEAEQGQMALMGVQQMAEGFLPQAQMMAGAFIGPYLDVLKAVNFGSYEVHVYLPKFRTYWNVTVALPSLNQFVNDKFLSS